VSHDEIPIVCFIDDLARILRTSRRTLEQLRRADALPIREVVGIDKRPRWYREDILKYLAGERERRLRRAG
jgi:hypothetical protein